MIHKPFTSNDRFLIPSFRTHLQRTLALLTLALFLANLSLPYLGQLFYIQTRAATNIKLDIKKTYKNNVQEEKQLTASELATDFSLPKNIEIETKSQDTLQLTQDKIKEIENKGGITFDSQNKAIVNKTVLASLGLPIENIEIINKLVDSYNFSSLKELSVAVDSDLVKNNQDLFGIKAKAACQYQHRVTWNWWGAELWMNNCLIEDIKIGALAGGSLAIIAGLEPTPLGELVAVYIGLYIGILDAKNGQCENRGANLNIPYIGASAMWVSSVC